MPKDKKAKVKKTKAPRKAQPLPKSVQALLKYLGGSDVKVGGGARGGQPAQLAPTSINIAVSQQQQQQQQQSQQQQQFIRQRVAPKGEIIGRSPLAGIIPQQPIIIPQPPAQRLLEDEKKKEEQLKKAEEEKNLINRKFALLEASQKDFAQFAEGKYWEIKNDIRRRITGDANMFDGGALAAKNRPVVEDPQFEGVSVGEEQGWIDVEQSAYQQTQYLQNITNPEMTPIERAKRGRKPLSEEVKKQRAEEKRLAKEAAKLLKAQSARPRKLKSAGTAAKYIPASSAQLLEESVTQEGAMRSITSAVQPSMPVQERTSPTTSFRPINIQGAPDMATQIAMMTSGGGAAAVPQSEGRTIAEMKGEKKSIKKILFK